MASTSPPDVMRSRIRRYMLTVFGLFLGAVVLLVIIAAVLKTLLEDSTAAKITGLLAPLVMLGVVVSSWVAVAKLWRCPSCEKNVFMLTSWNMSIFATAAAKNCPYCSVELFPAEYQRRTRNRFLLYIGIGIGLGMLGGMMAAMSSPKRAAQEERPAPPPPT